jgi:hypothetical protein
MFTQVKQSRNSEYLQVVESYREEGRVRQRSVLYVGHYDSLDDALDTMRRELRYLRGRATTAKRHYQEQEGTGASERLLEDCRCWAESTRRAVEDKERKLAEVKNLIAHNPQLLERDRERVAKLERQSVVTN